MAYTIMTFFISLLFFFFSLIIFFPMLYAQIALETSILNSPPSALSLETYSRYNSSSDNFPLSNFTICIGEENRTIYTTFLSEDNNSNNEIINGGNVTWQIFSVVNNISTSIVPFNGSFISMNINSSFNTTLVRAFDSIVLTNNGTKVSYKITANVSDSSGDSSSIDTFFTLQELSCLRVEQNVSLAENESVSVVGNSTELIIVVNESVSGSIVITEHDSSPVDSGGDSALDQYITVDVTGPLLSSAINLSITVNYSASHVSSKSLDESELQLYQWENNAWVLSDASINTVTNQITFFVNASNIGNESFRLGTFSIQGPLTNSSEGGSSPSGGSGGGGGGGGGGITGNLVNNAETSSQANPGSSRGGDGPETTETRTITDEDMPGAALPDLDSTKQEDLEKTMLTLCDLCIWIIILLMIVIVILLVYIYKQRCKICDQGVKLKDPVAIAKMKRRKAKKKSGVFWRLEKEVGKIH